MKNMELIHNVAQETGTELGSIREGSVVTDFATPWTVAHQAPLSMGFPRQEYWSGLPFPSPGNLLDLGIEAGRKSCHFSAHETGAGGRKPAGWSWKGAYSRPG